MATTTRTGKRTLTRAACTIGAAAFIVFCYSIWLNLSPPEKVFPTPMLPSPNGYDALIAAAKLEVKTDTQSSRQPARVFGLQNHMSLRDESAHVASNMLLLIAVRKALTLPYWHPPLRELSARLPEYAAFRELGHVLTEDAQVKAAARDITGSASASLDAIDLGVRIPRGGIVFGAVAGIGCESAGERQIWPLIDQLNADGAAAAAARLESITDNRVPFAQTLTEEQRFGQAVLLGEFRQRSLPGTYRDLIKALRLDSYQQRLDAMPFLDRADSYRNLISRSKRQVFDDYTTSTGLRIKRAEMPYDPGAEEIPEPDDQINGLLLAFFADTWIRNLGVRTQSGLLLTALALRAYRLRHAGYPANLADLVTDGILHRIPIDPFGRSSKLPLHYRRLTADKYLLYSVGADGNDNGGKPVIIRPEDQWHGFPEQDDNGDWVVGVNVGQPEHNGRP